MLHRPVSEHIESLRQTLADIEVDIDETCDPWSLQELRTIVLDRIAELEAESDSEVRPQSAKAA